MIEKILAADIGGTSSRFAAFSLENGEMRMEGSTWLKTAEADTFGALLKNLEAADFILTPKSASICVFAIAGPVEKGMFCKPPNIKWKVDLSSAEKDFSIKRFALINDFLAQAYACRSEIGRRAKKILDGQIAEDGVVGVIGAGTGLGKAFLLPDGAGGYLGGSSEGGHANLNVESARELEFQEFMKKEVGGNYATNDAVVCGGGLSRIHQFLTGEKLSPKEVAETFSKPSETLEWASAFYGRVCRNFALDLLATGGLYIAGGVAAKNPILIEHPNFANAFRDSRVHRKLLEQIPIFLNDNEESGLWGAGFLGTQTLKRGRTS